MSGAYMNVMVNHPLSILFSFVDDVESGDAERIRRGVKEATSKAIGLMDGSHKATRENGVVRCSCGTVFSGWMPWFVHWSYRARFNRTCPICGGFLSETLLPSKEREHLDPVVFCSTSLVCLEDGTIFDSDGGCHD